MPSKKINAGGLATAVAALAAWGMEVWLAPMIIPAAVIAAVGVIIGVAVSLAIPDELEE